MVRMMARAMSSNGWMARIAVAAIALGSPTIAKAQTSAGLAGVVKDATGAVLPGATVEAASPALIERVRTVITDDRGEYKITDLRPGTYSVTVTLSGFSTYKREGIELSAGFTATITAELKVGSLEETLTITGATPIVDTQNSRTQQVLKAETIDALPTGGKNLTAFASVTLGAVASSPGRNDVGGDKGENSTGIILHGGRGDDGRTNWDGMNTNVFFGNGGGQQRVYYFNTVGVQEVVVDTGGNSAEIETGGANINMVPKDGGNMFKAYGTAAYSSNQFSATQVSDDILSRGVGPQSSVRKIWDYGAGFGGPLAKDKIWFYTANRWWGSQNFGANNYFNKSSDPYHYVPDTGRPAYANLFFVDNSLRVTWQAGQKHKLTAEEHLQNGCNCWMGVGGGALTDPQATISFKYGPQVLSQFTWNYVASQRLLLQAGATFLRQEVNFVNVADTFNYFTGVANATFPGPNTYAITEQIGVPGGAPAGYTYGALTGGVTSYGLHDNQNNFNQKFALSYVTGSHAFKAGFQAIEGNYYIFGMQNGVNEVNYTFRGGVPVSLTEFAGPFSSQTRVTGQALYAQDQWTRSRLTLNLGIRFDHFEAHTLPANIPAGPFSTARSVPELDNLPNFKDITPRIGASYDLFGHGKTAIKANFGRYLYGQGGGLSQSVSPSIAIVTSVTRTWNDLQFGAGDPRTGNFIPDCVLTSPTSNGECGPISNSAFGQPVLNTTIAPSASQGWGNREYNYQTSIALQQEIRPGLGIAIGYFRTWWGNLTVRQNTLVSPGDFTQFCVAAPTDSRLGSVSASQVCGLYDVNPNKFGQVNNVILLAGDLGLGTPQELYNGFDFGFNVRWGKGALLQGGLTLGRETIDYCYANGHPELTPENFSTTTNYPRSSAYCHIDSPWWNGIGSQAKLQVVYPLPYDFQVSGTYKNLPGFPDTANLVLSNAQVAPPLGRSLSACPAVGNCTATFTAAIVPFGSNPGTTTTGTLFDTRLNQVDVRLTKAFRLNRTRLIANLDLYNLFNDRPPQGINATYGAAWLRPTLLLGGRLLKFGGQIDF